MDWLPFAMLNRRTTVGVIAVGVAVLAAALAYGAFIPGLPGLDGSGHVSQENRRATASPLTRSLRLLSIPPGATADLRLAPMNSLDRAAITRHRAEQAKAARAASNQARHKPKIISPASVPPIQRPLDLSLSSLGVPIIIDLPQPAHSHPSMARDTPARTPHDPPTLDLDPGVTTPTYAPDQSNKLFNRDNGLRGFMKQSWINQTLGFQGGLAIKPERLRENDSDLRDNMAVGMGVLLAF